MILVFSFGGLVFVRMLCSVVFDLNVRLLENLLPVLLNFSHVPGTYSVNAAYLVFSFGVYLLLCFYLHSHVSMKLGNRCLLVLGLFVDVHLLRLLV